MKKDIYIPEKGDIVAINFYPSTGTEMNKRRPGVVVSKYSFNKGTRFAVVCPITTKIRNYSSRYTIPSSLSTQGQIETAQLRSFDYIKRNIKFIEKLPTKDVMQLEQLIEHIFN